MTPEPEQLDLFNRLTPGRDSETSTTWGQTDYNSANQFTSEERRSVLRRNQQTRNTEPMSTIPPPPTVRFVKPGSPEAEIYVITGLRGEQILVPRRPNALHEDVVGDRKEFDPRQFHLGESTQLPPSWLGGALNLTVTEQQKLAERNGTDLNRDQLFPGADSVLIGGYQTNSTQDDNTTEF